MNKLNAKNAKCFIVFIYEFLCVLCVFAVKMAFMDGHWLFRVLPWPIWECNNGYTDYPASAPPQLEPWPAVQA
jgi:hypothetical protein